VNVRHGVWLLCLLSFAALAGCGARQVQVVQEHHGSEFRCDWRNVRVSHDRGERWESTGCGFRADWECRGRECELIDARSHGMSAP